MADWSNINVQLTTKVNRKPVTRQILSNVSGAAQPGRVLAILGPSGSGKSTLVNLIAGSQQYTKALVISGTVHRTGRVSLVEQDDLFVSSATVREVLTFHGALTLQCDPTDTVLIATIDHVLRHLNLTHVADTRVGDANDRGLSGGERKRLSIACALVVAPKILVLDEPTTGLDSWLAAGVVEQLRSIADSGSAVVAAIHQPRSASYLLFDDVLLLTAKGAVAFFGPREALEAHLAAIAMPVPAGTAASEWALDLVSVDMSTVAAEASSLERLRALADEYATVSKRFVSDAAAASRLPFVPRDRPTSTTESPFSPSCPAGWPTNGVAPFTAHPPTPRGRAARFVRSLKMLVARAVTHVARDRRTNRVRLTSNVSSGLLFGAIYWKASGRMDMTGLLQALAINMGMSSMQKTIRALAQERPLVRRELTAGLYGPGMYVLSKLVAEVPWAALFPLLMAAVLYPMTSLRRGWGAFAGFAATCVLEATTASAMGFAVGAWAPTADAATTIGPILMTIFIVFGGLYVRATSVPWFFKWVPAVSIVRRAFQAFVANDVAGTPGGQEYLEALALNGGNPLVAQAQTLVTCFGLTYLGFAARKTKFVDLAVGAPAAPAIADVDDCAAPAVPAAKVSKAEESH